MNNSRLLANLLFGISKVRLVFIYGPKICVTSSNLMVCEAEMVSSSVTCVCLVFSIVQNDDNDFSVLLASKINFHKLYLLDFTRLMNFYIIKLNYKSVIQIYFIMSVIVKFTQ